MSNKLIKSYKKYQNLIIGIETVMSLLALMNPINAPLYLTPIVICVISYFYFDGKINYEREVTNVSLNPSSFGEKICQK